MFNPQYIIKYVINRETKESETRIFDSTIKTLPDKFGNVEVDTTKPCSSPHSSFQAAQYACHILNMNHQQGYSGSDLSQMMERATFEESSGPDLIDQIVDAVDHYGYEVKYVWPGEWRITK